MRLTKAEAGYDTVDAEARRCGTCVYFTKSDNSCDMVEGNISAVRCCNLWADAKKSSFGDWLSGSAVDAKLAKSEKSINSSHSIVSGMPKPVRKEPEPEPKDEEMKSDTTIEPFKDEEKAQRTPPGPDGDEMKTAPAVKDTDPSKTESNSGDEDEEFEDALKAISTRFDNLEKAINALGDKFVAALEKSNYTSKPASVQGDYPTPPEAGPKSDGLQAPKIDQEDNPHSKPFGKTGKPLGEPAKKVALGGAADGSRERTAETVDSLREMRAAILKGETSIAKENAKLAQRKYGNGGN